MPQPLNTGFVLNGRYRIVKQIGKGGFGAVYRAWDISLSQPCALKENFDTSSDGQRQFQKEATTLAGLSHPNLPRVTDHFFVPNKGQFLVMDYIDGENLEDILARQGPVAADQALMWIEQVADALSYLHSQPKPIIHRDIKPQNIIITPADKAVLVDFGLVKVYDEHLKKTVGAKAVTPGYSPPEQYEHGQGKTDCRTDIYALGGTLYTLLTGQEPPESIIRVVDSMDTLRPANQINPTVPQSVSDTIGRAMSLSKTQRLQTVNEFVQELKGKTTTLSPPPPPPSTPPPLTPPPPPPPSLNKLILLILGIIIILGGISGTGWYFLGDDKKELTPTLIPTSTATVTATPIPTNTNTATPTLTPSPTATPTITQNWLMAMQQTLKLTPSPTATPTITPSPLPPTPMVESVVPMTNGDFELWATGWESTENTRIVTNGRSGQALQINNIYGGNSNAYYQLPNIVEEGETYKVTAWCKAEVGDECRLFFGDFRTDVSPPAYENKAIDIQPGTGEWQQLAVAVTLSRDEEMFIYLYAKNDYSSVLYDDVEVSLVDCQYICDGRFDEGILYWKSVENVDVITSGRTDNTAIRINYDGENAHTSQLSPLLYLAGATYRVSVWCKAFEGDECGLFFGDVGETVSPPAYDNKVSVTKEGNGKWQLLETTLTLTKDERLSVYLYARAADSSVVYDDLKIERIVE